MGKCGPAHGSKSSTLGALDTRAARPRSHRQTKIAINFVITMGSLQPIYHCAASRKMPRVLREAPSARPSRSAASPTGTGLVHNHLSLEKSSDPKISAPGIRKPLHRGATLLSRRLPEQWGMPVTVQAVHSFLGSVNFGSTAIPQNSRSRSGM